MEPSWHKGVKVGITVSDEERTILYMNDTALKIFERSGGSKLIGKNLLDCHPDFAQHSVLSLFEKKKNNCYTVVIDGIKYMLYQSPWFKEGEFAGFVEFIYSLPAEIKQLKKIRWLENHEQN